MQKKTVKIYRYLDAICLFSESLSDMPSDPCPMIETYRIRILSMSEFNSCLIMRAQLSNQQYMQYILVIIRTTFHSFHKMSIYEIKHFLAWTQSCHCLNGIITNNDKSTIAEGSTDSQKFQECFMFSFLAMCHTGVESGTEAVTHKQCDDTNAPIHQYQQSVIE